MEKPVNKNVEIAKSAYKKEERLCSKKIIDKLFSEGESFLSYPLKIVYLEYKLPTRFIAQAAFSVSKKNFKRAVKRNLLKRRMRECYRTNKYSLYKNCDKQLAVFFIYVGKEIEEYKKIEAVMKNALLRLKEELVK